MVSNPVVGNFLVWAAIVCHLGASGVLPHSQIRGLCYLCLGTSGPVQKLVPQCLAVQYRLGAEVAIRGTAISRRELGVLFCYPEIVWLYQFF